MNRRSQDGVVSLKHGRLAHVRSQFSLFRRSPTHKNLPPATFCASEHVLFGYFLHNAKSDKPFSLQRTSRFSEPRFSALQHIFPLTKLNPFGTFRGFPNLNSARRNGGFARTNLKPFPKEIRGSANLEYNFAQTKLYPFAAQR